jgi:general secretion pathway protein H
MKPGAQQWGFTLVEMLVVLSLLTLATAVSLPYARSSIEARRFETTVQNVALYMRDAQVSALASSHDVEVNYNIRTHQFASTAKQLPLAIPENVDLTFHSIDGQTKNQSAAYIFFATGGNSGGKIDLKRGEETKSVQLNWLTGAVTTETLEVSP